MIFLNVFAFLCVKANSKEIYRKISFPSFFRKMQMSAFCLDLRLIISKKNAWLPLFFSADSNSRCKDLLFPRGPNLAEKTLYLVGTVLKLSSWLRERKLNLKLSMFQLIRMFCFIVVNTLTHAAKHSYNVWHQFSRQLLGLHPEKWNRVRCFK